MTNNIVVVKSLDLGARLQGLRDTYVIEVCCFLFVWGVNEVVFVKYLEQWQAHSKHVNTTICKFLKIVHC